MLLPQTRSLARHRGGVMPARSALTGAGATPFWSICMFALCVPSTSSAGRPASARRRIAPGETRRRASGRNAPACIHPIARIWIGPASGTIGPTVRWIARRPSDSTTEAPMSSYRHVPHPHILRRKAARPVKVSDQFSRGGAIARFNTAFALKITSAVGSMWCAYVFAAIALLGLPSAIGHGTGGIVNGSRKRFFSSSCCPSSSWVRTCKPRRLTKGRKTPTRTPRRCCMKPCKSRSTYSPRMPNSDGSSPRSVLSPEALGLWRLHALGRRDQVARRT